MNKSGKPSTIKQINESIIRNMFMRRTTLSCAEISKETGISITTVRAVMNEMLAREELLSLGLGNSSGGRRSEQFIINDDCYEGISLCITEHEIYRSIINIHANIKETKVFSIDKTQYLTDIITLLLNDRINKKTKAIGIGVPGIVSARGFISNIGVEVIDTVEIVPLLQERFSMPIFIENDLRASSLGFSKEIQNDSPAAFIHFEKCNNQITQISAGFVEGGSIIHGMGNYAGELGIMPFDNKQTFREALYNAATEKARMKIIAQLVSMICCTINPQNVMLCSNVDYFIDGDAIEKLIANRLPSTMMPKISVGGDYKKYFMLGMAELTSDGIFDSRERS
jgi:hypothetical protein